jgi:hypothetical protein
VALLVALSPVAAAGQVGTVAQLWWRKVVRAGLQLIALKPAVALILALGLSLPGTSGQVEKLLSGMVVLLLAACAWPAMARVSAVMEVHVGGGFLAGIRTSLSARVAGQAPGGVDPAELSRVAESRTMSALHELTLRAGGALPTSASAPRAWPQAGHLPPVAGLEARPAAVAAGAKDQPSPVRISAGHSGHDGTNPGETT